MIEKMKEDIDSKKDICLQYAEDAMKCLENLTASIKENKFAARSQILAKDVLILAGDIQRTIGELIVLQNLLPEKERVEDREATPGHADAPRAARELPSFAVSCHEYMSFLDD